MEEKGLMIRKKNYGYYILATVFVASIVISIFYFSNIKSGEKTFSGDKLAIKNENRIEKLGEEISKLEEKEEKKEYTVELDPNKPMVALTFDDGPDPKRTYEILDILKKYNVHATFFDIGLNIEKNPEVTKAEFDSGSDVGGHTYSHVNLNKLSQKEVKEDIKKLEDAYKKATNEDLVYVRPTYGNANAQVREVINHPLINWNVDSLDWKYKDADKVIEEIYKTENLDGKIIILHSIYDSTVKAVSRLIPDLIDKGYQIVSISEMSNLRGYSLENGKIYYSFK